MGNIYKKISATIETAFGEESSCRKKHIRHRIIPGNESWTDLHESTPKLTYL